MTLSPHPQSVGPVFHRSIESQQDTSLSRGLLMADDGYVLQPDPFRNGLTLAELDQHVQDCGGCLVSAARLRELLHYDPLTGIFTWLVSTNGRVKVGDVAGTRDQGYVIISVDRRLYRAHRLAWLYVYGQWPKFEIDHDNQVKDDNRIANLLDVPHQRNMHNIAQPTKVNRLGARGVEPYGEKYRAFIGSRKNRKFLGTFDCLDGAQSAYQAAWLERRSEGRS